MYVCMYSGQLLSSSQGNFTDALCLGCGNNFPVIPHPSNCCPKVVLHASVGYVWLGLEEAVNECVIYRWLQAHTINRFAGTWSSLVPSNEHGSQMNHLPYILSTVKLDIYWALCCTLWRYTFYSLHWTKLLHFPFFSDATTHLGNSQLHQKHFKYHYTSSHQPVFATLQIQGRWIPGPVL